MNRTLCISMIVLFASGIFAESVNYKVYSDKTRNYAKKIAPFSGRFYTYAEDLKSKGAVKTTFERTLLAVNNAETALLSIKNLSDLLVVCAYTKQLKKDTPSYKNIIAFSHRSMRRTLGDIEKRVQWASDQVKLDVNAGVSSRLTTVLKDFISEYNAISPVLDKLTTIVTPSAEREKAAAKQKPKERKPAAKAKPGEPATVYILSIPPNAKVYMDGTYIGKTNLDQLKVSPGEHRMQFTVEGKVLNQRMIFTPGDNGKKFVTIK